MVKKYECPSCGYVYDGSTMPFDFRCPICRTSGAIFNEVECKEQTPTEVVKTPLVSNAIPSGKRTLNLSECKAYVGKIKDLEVLCYQLDKLRTNLDQKKKQLECDGRKYSSIKPQQRPEKVGVVTTFIMSTVYAAVAALVGTIPGVVIGFLRWVFSGKTLWSLSGHGSEPLKPYLVSTMICTALIFGVVCFIFCFYIGTNSDKNIQNKIDAYEKKEQKRVSDIDRCNTQLSIVQDNISKCCEEYSQTKELLDKYYSLNYIYPKYRGMIPICTIYEYLESGRCFSLLGHEGAYNLYESELRMDRIIEKLDDIIYRLDDISASQRVLANEIKRSNAQIDRICSSLDSIERNTALTQYYSSISATNTSYLAWLAFLEQK